MTSFKNAALTTTVVATSDVALILGAHNVTENEIDLVTFVCLTCHSIGMAPDTRTKALVQRDFDPTCCSPEATILP